jgi:hypothetical protein
MRCLKVLSEEAGIGLPIAADVEDRRFRASGVGPLTHCADDRGVSYEDRR